MGLREAKACAPTGFTQPVNCHSRERGAEDYGGVKRGRTEGKGAQEEICKDKSLLIFTAIEKILTTRAYFSDILKLLITK